MEELLLCEGHIRSDHREARLAAAGQKQRTGERTDA
jgi:hypothetical protein